MSKIRMQLNFYRLMLAFAFVAFSGGFQRIQLVAGDWPMWRANAQRTGYVPRTLPLNLHLQWQRDLTPATPAWPTGQDKLRFDDASNAVVVGRRIFVNSSTIDALTAYDTRTGEQLWRFFADGPVRFAPVATATRVYFTSDDGFLYCLDSESGELLWKKRGGPSERLILGNGRMISSWPARGGPVLDHGKVYFAASIWPFMGIFIHAVDAETGDSVWTNSGDGTNLTIQPHGAPSFATVVPQGHLVISNDHLIVPGGRSVPAVYDRRTGKLLHFEYVKKHGGHNVMTTGDQYFVNGTAYRATDGQQFDDIRAGVFDEKHLISFQDSQFVGYATDCERIETTTKDRLGRTKTNVSFQRKKTWTQDIRGRIDRVIAKSGDLLWTNRGNRILAFNLTKKSERPEWVHEFESDVWDVLVADDRLFVVTTDNRLFCFGSNQITNPNQFPMPMQIEVKQEGEKREDFETQIDRITQGVDTTGGYALVLSMKSKRLVDALCEGTELNVVILPSENEQYLVSACREDLVRSRQYGNRVAILPATTSPESLPKYFASLICSESSTINASHLLRLYDSLRPYGGKLCVPVDSAGSTELRLAIAQGAAQKAHFTSDGTLVTVTRDGPLPGTDDWTHQYANAAQSGISQESVVRAPLGVLWFGGVSHEGILPRHGHGPSPQVAGGRLVIEGPDLLRAIDIYTGRQLWQIHLPGIGKFYDNTRHMPGAGEIGSNYVTLADRVYIVFDERLLELNAVDGKIVREYGASSSALRKPLSANWGYLGVDGNYLIATSAPVAVVKSKNNKAETRPERPIIAASTTWKYFAEKSDLPANWKSVDFDDGGWKHGTAGFGYGDDDDKTELLEMKDRISRVLLRRSFDATHLAGAKKLVLYCKFDDGFVAYLNGHEICRSHMRGSGLTAEVESHEADEYEAFDIQEWATHVVPGQNVLAIEAHNRDTSSSDFSIDPYLVIVPGLRSADSVDEKAQLRELLEPASYSSGSLRINVFDRVSGERLWYRDAEYNFRHNNLCAANGKLFCIDMLSVEKRRALERRGLTVDSNATLYALDLRNGEVIWRTAENVFGTFLNYSAEHDVLVQGGSLYRDRAYDEVGKGIVAYQGATGDQLWSDMELSYNGPVLLWKDKIVTNGNGGFSLDMLTGERTGWKYEREYGCNTAIGCQNLLTFRSGAAGYYDLLSDSGTSNLGGFRSSCTNNLIPACGILNAPDYTRTCTCSYQNQTSLALIHMPEAEAWSFGGIASPNGLAVNFGAPGDRRSPSGTLWVDYPSVGGNSPSPNIQTRPSSEQLKSFRLHAGLVSGEQPWISASGAIGIREISVKVESNDEKLVRLFLCEPERIGSGKRTFEISANGKIVDLAFDVSRIAGGPYRGITQEFAVKPDSNSIRITFTPSAKAAKAGFEPIVSGIEITDKD